MDRRPKRVYTTLLNSLMGRDYLEDRNTDDILILTFVSQEISYLLWNLRFITVFTRAVTRPCPSPN
jgi:hypothetical protein